MIDDRSAIRIDHWLVYDWMPMRGVDISIEKAWLPVIVLDGVAVTVQTQQPISKMERFVLEAVLRLGTLEARELNEIASIPADLADWLLESLRQKRLLVAAGGKFEPDVERCAAALEACQLAVERVERRDLLWFPETDEVVALESSGDVIREIRKIMPSGSWPVPLRWRDRTRAAVLDEPRRAGRFYGHSANAIVGISDATAVKGETFPAYVCSAAASASAVDGEWRLRVHGVKRRGKRLDTQTPEMISVALQVPRLPALVERWRRRILDARAAVVGELQRAHGFCAQPTEEIELSVCLRESEAQALSRENLIAEVAGVKIRIDDEFEYTLPLHCSPANEGAARVFAVDRAVRRFLSDGRNTGEPDDVPQEILMRRLWELKLFKPLYDLREAEDFAV